MTTRKPPAPAALPPGPALVYVAHDGTPTTIDETAVTSPRDRAICRALLQHAGKVLTDAEAESPKNPVGFQAPAVGPPA